jgi:hypothetical protein
MTWKSILKLYPDRNQIWNQSATLGKAVLFALAAWVVSFIAHADPAGTPRPDFAVGQMWSIKSAGPTTAKVVVGRIETWNGMTAIHVSLIDIPVPRDTEGRGKLITIEFLSRVLRLLHLWISLSQSKSNLLAALNVATKVGERTRMLTSLTSASPKSLLLC